MKIYVCHTSVITAVSQYSKKIFLLYCWKTTLTLIPDQTLLAPVTIESVFRSYNLFLRILQVLTFRKLIYRKMYLWNPKDYHRFPRHIFMLRNCLQRRVALKASYGHLCSINVSIDNDSELKLINDALTDELQWLCLVVAALDDKNLTVPGWSTYHASFKWKPIDPPGINTILPLLKDKVHTLIMQVHCMLLNINSVKVLNEGQTLVDTYDQPLCTDFWFYLILFLICAQFLIQFHLT